MLFDTKTAASLRRYVRGTITEGGLWQRLRNLCPDSARDREVLVQYAELHRDSEERPSFGRWPQTDFGKMLDVSCEQTKLDGCDER